MNPRVVNAAYDLLLRLIEEGILKDGQHVNARVLSEEHSIPEKAIRQAFGALRSQKRLSRISTLGWYVGDHIAPPKVPRNIRAHRSSIAADIAKRVIDEIDTGIRTPGTPLYQRDIAQEFDVSVDIAGKIIRKVVDSSRAAVPENSQTALVLEQQK